MREEKPRKLIAAGYLLAGMFVLVPLLELVANAWPPTFSAARWRFGAAGYLGNVLLLPTFGICLGIVTAMVLEHRRVLRTLSTLAGLGALFLGVLAISLTLDAVQLRGAVAAPMRRSFDIASAKALITICLAATLFVWIGLTGWHANSRVTKARVADRSPLVSAAAQPLTDRQPAG